MDYLLDLVRGINEYDGSDEKFIILRDMVCSISTKPEIVENSLANELLFVAACKMRTFGYNAMNSNEYLYDGNMEKDGLFHLQNRCIKSLYTTESGLLLDKAQFDIVQRFNSLQKRRLLVSAPTSFGKTFILREILYCNRDNYKNIALIFPTISLLNENYLNFKEFNSKLDMGYTVINSTHKVIKNDSKNILILTPERLLKILNDNPEIEFDFFFMDEIYKIDKIFNDDVTNQANSDRDSVFRIVLYLLAKTVKDYYLAGPYLDGESMQEGLKLFIEGNGIEYIQIDTELVQKYHYPAWNRILRLSNENYRFTNTTKIGKCCEIISLIKSKGWGQTLVYGESKKKVMDLARAVSESVKLNPNEREDRISKFINHLEYRYGHRYQGLNVSGKWTMISTLKNGIGVHHGGFPKYIQNEVLSLYNDELLHTIFSTTSITEGVNTKSENIVFYGKRKGTTPLRVFDIKNINGRAGRYYHHFIGRVFYLEKEIYERLGDSDDGLDYVTFTDKEIPEVDIDNTEYVDLATTNRSIKEERERIANSYGIDESIFTQNRLVDKLTQIKLIELIKSQDIINIQYYVDSCNNIGSFLRNKLLYEILGMFSDIGLVEEYNVARYGKIASDYSRSNGFNILLRFHLDNCDRITEDVIDKAYMNVFSDIRNIVEFKIPKFLTVFGNLLEYVCSSLYEPIDTSEMSMDSIIRFYELGVKTEIGVFLVENGFPIPTVKIMERDLKAYMDNTVDEIVPLYYSDYHEQISQVLDSYEMDLFENIIKNYQG